MLSPIAYSYLAKALRDERRPQPFPRYPKVRTPLRARLPGALGLASVKPALRTKSEVRS